MDAPQTPDPIAPAKIQLLQLKNADEAFRATTMLLAADPNYQQLPLHTTTKVLHAIQRQHYQLLTVGHQAVGCILWAEISHETLDRCVAQQREPTPDQLCTQGDAIIALGLVASTPALVRLLWRSFVRINRARPILAIRHFGKLQLNAPRFIVYRNGQKVRVNDPVGRTHAGQTLH